MICTPYQIFFGRSKVRHVAQMGERKVHTGFWWENLTGKIPVGRLRRLLENNIKMNLQLVGWGIWNELMSLRIGRNGRLLWMWKITSGFH